MLNFTDAKNNQRGSTILYPTNSPLHWWRGGRGEVLLALLLLLTLSACTGLQASAGTAPAPGTNAPVAIAQGQVATSTPIPTAPAVARPTYLVQRGDVADILETTGRWLPRDQLSLSFPTAGQVRTVYVQRGAAVRAGDKLADLQITELENSLASANVSLEAAKANISQNTSITQSIQNAQISLANARLRLEQIKSNAPWANVNTAYNNMKSAEAALEKAQRDLDAALSRPEQAASTVTQARESVRQAEVSYKNAQNSYYSAAQNYNSNKLDQQTQENAVIQAELNLKNAQLGTDVDPNKLSTLQNAQLRVDQLKQQIEQATLRAPIDGEILDVNLKPGDSVKAFDTLMTIGKSQPREVVASIAFGDASQLTVGLIGIAQPLNRPDQAVQSIVRRVPLNAREADQTTRVAAQLDSLQTGAIVELKLPKRVRQNVLWLPPVAIRTFQGRNFVVLQTPDGPRSVDVTIGLQTRDRVEITAGVNEGDVVVGP
jgi:multidrug efflux pump subunit AcrA (membrane-fusion protein)